jgi:hypothetical protein
MVVEPDGTVNENTIIPGQTYFLTTADGNEYVGVAGVDMYTTPGISLYDSNGVEISFRALWRDTNDSWNTGDYIERYVNDIKKIDHKYISVDWNSNDLSIKNKTHYSHFDYEIGDIIINSSVSNQYGNNWSYIDSSHIFENYSLGHTYVVSLDGVEYICQAH